MSSIITNVDVLSTDAHLLFHKGSKRAKNLFGGLLSLTTFILIFGITLYFFLRLIDRSNSIIMSSLKFSAYHNITNIHEVPFMIRLGGTGTRPIPNDTLIYKVWMEEWILDEGKETQYSIVHQLEPCTLEHVNLKFRFLFENFTDLNTFKCLNWTGIGARHLYGINGATKTANSHFDFNFRKCYPEKDGVCLPASQVATTLATNAFLDFRQLDYDIDHQSLTPYKPIVKQDRLFVSSLTFTKIWWNLRVVEYISDFGFLFEDKQTETFFQFDNLRQTMDFRDIEKTRTQAFVQFTIQPFELKTLYSRTFEKAQNVMANAGGIIKFITLSAQLIYFSIAHKLYFDELNNSIILPQSESNSQNAYDINRVSLFTNNINNIKNSQMYPLKNAPGSVSLERPRVTIKTPLKHIKAPSPLDLRHLICPFLFFKNNHKITQFHKLSKIVNQHLNIKNIITKMIEIEKVKDLIMDDNQKKLYDCIIGKENITDQVNQNALITCKEKQNKDLIDKNILKEFAI